MRHLEPDQLALLAMGEPVASPGESEHLSTCPACGVELDRLAHAVQVGRATIDVGELESPAPVVWDRIVDELRLRTGDAAPAATSAAASTAAPASDTPSTALRSRTGRRARRRFGAVWALAAAIVLVAAAGLGSWAVIQRTALTPVAEARLAAFPDHPGASGTAVVEESRDGARSVRVTLDAADVADTYREVWLITADATALVSLGVLVGDEATFPIPNGVDIRDYVLVDISDEPVDGDPAHSGDSIVRGELEFA